MLDANVLPKISIKEIQSASSTPINHNWLAKCMFNISISQSLCVYQIQYALYVYYGNKCCHTFICFRHNLEQMLSQY